MKNRYEITVINLSAFIGIIALLLFTFFNWKTLSGNGGWGVVGVFGILLFILTSLVIDLIFQLVFNNKKLMNILGMIVVIIYGFIFFEYS